MAEIDKQLIEVLSVLSESVRFKILSLISSKGELTAKDILSEFDFTQPTLSHHMSCLTEAGLVNVERRGRFAYYSVNKDTIDLVLSGIESLKSGSKKTEKAKASFDNTDKEVKKSKKKKKKDKGKKKKLKVKEISKYSFHRKITIILYPFVFVLIHFFDP